MLRFTSIGVLALLALAGCTKIDAKAPGNAPAAEAPKPAGKVRLIPAPDYPDAAVIVADQLVQTEAAHRRLLVYVGAPWCEPCQRFHAAAEKGELDGQLPDLDLMVFDSERDHGRLVAAGYTSKYIPLFVIPGADGRSTGRQTEGGLTGERAVGQLVPRLQSLIGERD